MVDTDDGEERVVKNRLVHRIAAFALALATAGLLGGCATSGNPRDPIEGFNRAIFDLNDVLDKGIVKPVAQGYDLVLPPQLKTGISNVFGNIEDIFIAVNNLLQGKVGAAAGDVSRVFINTTIGVLGIFDIATEAGIEKHDEDFGQTLGYWGIGDSVYLVLPVLGPSTLRDAFGKAADLGVDPIRQIDKIPSRNRTLALRTVNERARLLPTDKIVEEAALDRYSYVRDAYLQMRRSKVYDGDPPRENDNVAVAPTKPDTVFAEAGLERVVGATNLFVMREPAASAAMLDPIGNAVSRASAIVATSASSSSGLATAYATATP